MPLHYPGTRDHEIVVAVLQLHCLFENHKPHFILSLLECPSLISGDQGFSSPGKHWRQPTRPPYSYPKRRLNYWILPSTVTCLPFPATGDTTHSPGSNENSLWLFHPYYFVGGCFGISLTFLFCVFVFS